MLPPYVAVMPLLEVGPKLLPVIVIDSEPAVAIVPPDTDRPLMAGSPYPNVTEERELAWPPTVTIHLCPVLTPAGDVQVTSEFALVTEHDVAV